MIQFDEHIFQSGWFNHQLAMILKKMTVTYSLKMYALNVLVLCDIPPNKRTARQGLFGVGHDYFWGEFGG